MLFNFFLLLSLLIIIAILKSCNKRFEFFETKLLIQALYNLIFAQ